MDCLPSPQNRDSLTAWSAFDRLYRDMYSAGQAVP
jgi:hypothetical protein